MLLVPLMAINDPVHPSIPSVAFRGHKCALPVVPVAVLLMACLVFADLQRRRVARTDQQVNTNSYQWDIGTLKSTAGPIPITYLIGMPISPQLI